MLTEPDPELQPEFMADPEPEPEATLTREPEEVELDVGDPLEVLTDKLNAAASMHLSEGGLQPMLEVIDSLFPKMLQPAFVLCETSEQFRTKVLEAVRSNKHGHLGASLLWAVHETANEFILHGDRAQPQSLATQAYKSVQCFEAMLRPEHPCSELLLRVLFPQPQTPPSPSLRLGDSGSTGNYSVDRLLERLVVEASRPFAYAPLLFYLRQQLRANLGDASGQQSTALREGLGARLAAVEGIEALFLRKELAVGKFELEDLPFWTGAINMAEPEEQGTEADE